MLSIAEMPAETLGEGTVFCSIGGDKKVLSDAACEETQGIKGHENKTLSKVNLQKTLRLKRCIVEGGQWTSTSYPVEGGPSGGHSVQLFKN